MPHELCDAIDARMTELGIASFSLYIQLVTRRDVTNGGPMEIPVLPSEGQGPMPTESQTHLPLPDDTGC